MSPIVTDSTRISENPQTYTVHERIPLLFGSTTEIEFQVTFTDNVDGVTTVVHAPMGLESTAVYTVLSVEDAKAQVETAHNKPGEQPMVGPEWRGEDWVLRERVDSKCSVLTKWYVDRELVKTRREIGARMMRKLQDV